MAKKGKKSPGGAGRGGDGVEYLGVIKGEKLWRARITYKDPKTGKKKDTKAIFEAGSKILAMQERDKRIRDAKKGRTPRTIERKKFGEAAEAWFETIKVVGTRVSWGSYKRQLVARFGDYYLEAVTTEDLQEFFGTKAHCAATTVNHVRQVATKIYAFAIKKGWATENPAKATEPRSERKERAAKEALEDPPKRSLTMDELIMFPKDLHEKDRDLWPIACTQFVLGQRIAETTALFKRDIDWNTSETMTRRGQVLGTFGPTKGRYARRGAIGMGLLAVLKEHVARVEREQWPGHEELLFPRPPSGHRRQSNAWSYRTVNAGYKRSWKRCGIPIPKGVGTHALRRAMVDALREEASNILMRKMVGHSDEEMSVRYSEAQLAEVIQIADYLGSAVRVETGK